MQQKVYRFKKGDKEHGSIRKLKDGIDFNDYLKKLESKEETAIKIKKPSVKKMMEWELEGGCKAVDGCWVEPDGICQHGYPSFMLVMGII